MAPTIGPTTFPLDGILKCGTCGCAMALQHNPLPQYVCENSCDVPTFKAIELNHLAIKTLYDVLVTDHTRDAFTKQMEGAFDQLEEEQPSVTVDGPPTDAQIRELLEDPQAILQHESMSEARHALCEAMIRIEIHGQTATIHYAMPLAVGRPDPADSRTATGPGRQVTAWTRQATHPSPPCSPPVRSHIL